MIISPALKAILPVFLRFAVYIVGMTGCVFVIFCDATSSRSPFKETSWVEITQLILLLASTLICLRTWRGRSVIRHAAWLLGTFTCVSFIRECDTFFDTYMFRGCWQLFVTSTLALSLAHLWRHWQSLLAGLNHYLSTLSCGLFMGGFLTTYVFSRLFGARVLWATALQDGYLKIAKTMAEECTELLGYVLLLYAAIEMHVAAQQSLRLACKQPDHRG